jgi:endonuclease/exonuclease/phosphatase family metal-dependent hydrolase
MRIVSYNIYNGGEGRADPLAEVILAQRPDVVALVEADDSVTLQRIARRLKMDYIEAPGRQHTSALLSRCPITETINHGLVNEGLTRSFLEATVLDDGGVEWPIGVLHLHPGATNADEALRRSEMDVVLKILQRHRETNRPHLLVGDFNSNAPYQRIEPQRCKIKTRQAWLKNGSNLPREVIQKITMAGYLDTYHELHDEKAEMVGTFDTQNPGQRVDYIFSFGVEKSKIKSAWIEQDRLAKYASDHFPIGAEIS